MQLSFTSKRLLAIFFANPNQEFYINELIRKTGLYPNSIQQSLQSLEKQLILTSNCIGRRKFYGLNKNYKFLNEIRKIITENVSAAINSNVVETEWLRIGNRTTEIPFSHWIFVGERDYINKFIDLNYENFWLNSITGGIYYYKDHILKAGQLISEKIREDQEFARTIVTDCTRQGESLTKKIKKVPLLNLPNLTNKQIHHALKRLLKEFAEFMPFLLIPISIETVMTKEINSILEGLNLLEKTLEKAKKIVAEPTNYILDEQMAQLRLAAHVKKRGWNKYTNSLLGKLTSESCWLPMFSINAIPFDKEYFRNVINDILKKTNSPQKEINLMKTQSRRKNRELKNFLNKVGATEHLKSLVSILQSYINLRTYRINVCRKFNYYHLPFLYEIAKRMKISENDIKYLTYPEMLSWLKYGYGKSFGYSQQKLQEEINSRASGWAILMWKKKIRIISGMKNIIEAIERYKLVTPTPTVYKLVRGNIACRGKVTGRVKIVRNMADIEKVKKGDVLVAKMTTPDYVIAMYKAAAIITDEGGVTCHAAIVSREFNIPCIVGTRNATQILSNNDLVEVDALEGVVRVIESIEIPEDVKVISGKTIYRGKARGLARIILDAADFSKIKSGDILIALQTTPEYLSSLYRVKGFIVDEESPTSHSVLYGKALRLPSIMGTEFARNVIQDGEEIELDATNGLIRRFI